MKIFHAVRSVQVDLDHAMINVVWCGMLTHGDGMPGRCLRAAGARPKSRLRSPSKLQGRVLHCISIGLSAPKSAIDLSATIWDASSLGELLPNDNPSVS